MIEQLWPRLRRALFLEGAAFEEFRDDASFTAVGAGLAAAVALLGGLGAWLWGEFNLDRTPDGFFVDAVILGSIFTFLLWLAWIVVAYFILTQVFRETAAPDALFRVFSVGIVPLALGFFVFVPELNLFLGVASIALMFYLTMFGLRAAFAIDPLRLLLAGLAGFAVFAIVMSLLITVDNSFVNGAFVFEATEDSATKDYDGGNFDIGDYTPPE